MMKALVRDRYGPPAEVLRFEEVAEPVPVEDEVLVRIRASSLNATDLDWLLGRPGLARIATGLRGPRNPRLGVDVAGVVEAVGPAVTRLRVGDEVFGDLYGHGFGAFADKACARERAFRPKPASLTIEEAATLPHAGILALHGLRAGGPIHHGERVLINGASGNVGPFAIQMAKARGAVVTGVCSTPKLEFVTSIGADDVIDYTTQSYTRLGRTWDRILDVAANKSLLAVRRALAPGGSYTWLGGTTGTLLQSITVGPLQRLVGGRRMGMATGWGPFRPGDVAELIRLVESGAVRPIIDRTYPMAEAIDALAYLHEGRARGKVVLTAAS
jgi:NADPH:quinone reductase-like Zn-dependent oxidoreductase